MKKSRIKAQPQRQSSADEIEEHFGTYFGRPAQVFHEIRSKKVHVDIHVIPPPTRFDPIVLFTTGMSDLPMAVPRGFCPHCDATQRHAELVIRTESENALPIAVRWMQRLAHYPHDERTWIGAWHTYSEAPARPLGVGTRMSAWLFTPLVHDQPEAGEIELADGRHVQLLEMHALHEAEHVYAVACGVPALVELFSEFSVRPVFDPGRACVAPPIEGAG